MEEPDLDEGGVFHFHGCWKSVQGVFESSIDYWRLLYRNLVKKAAGAPTVVLFLRGGHMCPTGHNRIQNQVMLEFLFSFTFRESLTLNDVLDIILEEGGSS